MSAVLPRRATLGAGALFSVLLLVVAAAGVLAVYYADRADAERRAEDREAGRVFALHFAAAHRASMTNQGDYRVAQPDGSFVVTAGSLTRLSAGMAAAVPPGLPATAGRGATFVVGIIDDGGGVPMAFGVLEPQDWAHTASLREGALEGGLAQIEDFSGSGSEMHVHVAAIQTALGRAPATDALFVTADRGVRYRDGVVYRRAQPGQSRLNRMETTLNAGGCAPPDNDQPCDLLDGGSVAADGVSVTPDASAPVESRVGGQGTVGWLEASSVDVEGRCEDSGGNEVRCSAPGAVRRLCEHPGGGVMPCSDPGAGRPSGNFTGHEVSGSELTVNAGLVVGRSVSVEVETGDMDVVERSVAGAVVAGTGHAEMGGVFAGTLSAQDVRVVRTGGASAGLEGLRGPRANIGTLTVGSCAGCYPE